MPIMLTLIGIDAAAQRTKTGYAIASWDGSSALIQRSGVMDHRGAAMAVLVDALRAGPCLIGIDAPLGWPMGLREALADHLAGQALSRLPDQKNGVEEWGQVHFPKDSGARSCFAALMTLPAGLPAWAKALVERARAGRRVRVDLHGLSSPSTKRRA